MKEIQKFQQAKKNQFSKKDRSDKQNWDKRIIKLCKRINSKQEYYTTSSCAGRILLIKAEKEKKPDLFLFRTHKKISFSELKRELEKVKKKIRKREGKKLIYFKQEACILHVACRDLEAAQRLIDKAKLAGWKKSGIISTRKRIVCELLSTEKIELPIVDKGKILLSDSYLKLLVKEANKKLSRTRKKIKRFESLL